jgi:hypothetical protein
MLGRGIKVKYNLPSDEHNYGVKNPEQPENAK